MEEYQKSGEITEAMSPEEEADVELIVSKKRKVCSSERGNLYCGGMKLLDTASSATYGCSDEVDKRSGGVQTGSRSPDLENVDSQSESESFEMEISTLVNGCFSNQSTPTSEFCGDSEEVLMEPSTPKKKKLPKAVKSCPNLASSMAEKMPSEGEVEEFFAAAEKYEQKMFAEKYNYDFVKDVPLEGRYQWVRLQP